MKRIITLCSAILLGCSAAPLFAQQSPEKMATPKGPYPVITIPETADPESPDWKGVDLTPSAPVLPLSPAEELKKIELKPGYKLELVLSDPDIMEASAIAFDGNGRMYVLELLSYMQDIDANGETDPVGRISRHEDKNNDGVYETHTVFLDKMVFPRFVMPLADNSILSMESHQDNVYKYTDTNNDGKADKKEFFASGFGRGGNVEHQQTFLTWSMDNWLYSTYNAVRLRWTPTGESLREPTGQPGGAWGVTQDNYGKTYIQAGASGLPGPFQFPIEYGTFNIPGQLDPGLRTPYGLPIRIADMQGGMDQVRMPDGSLNSTTAGAGNDIYRGDRLPKELIGQYFYGEEVARIVRRVDLVKSEGLTVMKNHYENEKTEFIRSTDPLFRPVDFATAPDGTMYIVDMYRGIIQQGTWTNPGSYLRAKVQQYQLDKVVRHGRIWRLTYEGMDRDKTQPKMLSETPAQLVAHLSHPNGWWRDMAQQTIIQRQDKSVVPALQALVNTSTNQFARMHALWTLEGLGVLDAATARKLMKDTDPQIRLQAIRASETLYKAGDKTFINDYIAMTKDPDTDVAIQGILTANVLKAPDIENVIKAAQAANPAKGVQEVGNQILTQITAARNLAAATYTPEERELLAGGEAIFAELCSECHGITGLGKPMAESSGANLAPTIAGSLRVQGHPEYVVKVLLHGLTGPIDGKTFPSGVMASMSMHNDAWIAGVASYIRNNFGNKASIITPEFVAKVRASTEAQDGFYTYAPLMKSVPQALEATPAWKVSASEVSMTTVGQSPTAASAFTFEGWSTVKAQEPGMWFQAEMPAVATLTEIQFTSAAPRGQAFVPGSRPGTPGALAGGGPPTGNRGGAPAGAPGVAPAGGAQGAAPAVGGGAPGGGGGGGGRGFNAGPPRITAPRAYTVEVSLDGKKWTKVAEGESKSNNSVIAFAPVKAKFVRMNQTGKAEDGSVWSMQTLKFFEMKDAATAKK